MIQKGKGKEYEAKFLDIDVNKYRALLKKNGAKVVHKRIKYIRSVFKRADNKVKGFARVRKESGDTTMTVKIYNNPKYPDEYEVTIKDDFSDGRDFLNGLGLKEKAFQESFREKYSFPKVKGVHEITIDELPGLPPYTEIDCTSEKALYKVIELLKLNKDNMRFGAFDATYNEYYGISKNVINDKTKSLTFKNIIKEIKPKKNKDLLKKIANKQRKM